MENDEAGAVERAPLRANGIYAWKDETHQVLDLGHGWKAWGLCRLPFQKLLGDMHYVQPGGSILDVHFRVVGTIEELVDTGRDVVE